MSVYITWSEKSQKCISSQLSNKLSTLLLYGITVYCIDGSPVMANIVAWWQIAIEQLLKVSFEHLVSGLWNNGYQIGMLKKG